MKRKIALLFAIAAATIGAFLLLNGRRTARVPPTDFIPAETGRVVILDSAERLGRELSRLAGHRAVKEALAQVGIPSAEGLLDELASRLGADIRDAKSLTAAGIDGAAPAYAFTLENKGGAPVIAIPFTSQDAIRTWLDGRMQALFGGTPRQGESGTRFLHYVSGESGPVIAAAVMHGGYLYVARGTDGERQLEQALATAANTSLSSHRPFHDGALALGRPTLRAFAQLSGVQSSAGLDLSSGAELKAHLAAEKQTEAARTKGSKTYAAEILTLLAGLSAFQTAPAEITSRLDPEAALLAQSGISPLETAQLFTAIAPKTAGKLGWLLAPTGMTLEKLAAEFQPGAAMSVSLAPRANLLALTSLARLRSVSAFDIVHLEFLAKVRDEENIRRFLDAAARSAPAVGIQVQRFAQDGTFIDSPASPMDALKGIAAALGVMNQNAAGGSQGGNEPKASRWVCGFRQGEGFTVELKEGVLLVAGGGKQVYDALASRAAAAKVPRDLGSAGAVLHLDVKQLISSIRAIPESSFGIGGAAIKATLDKWLRTFDGIQSLRVSASGSGGGALDLTASLELQDANTAGSRKAVP